jgi:hypothetical protein
MRMRTPRWTFVDIIRSVRDPGATGEKLMRTQGSFVVVAAVVAILGSALVTSTAGQTGNFTRTSDGRPDLNGIWQVMNTANWDLEDHQAKAGPPQLGVFGAVPPGLGVVEGGEIPYKPAALYKRRENFKNRFTEDPEAKCYMPGVPRATYLPYPFQIIQGNTKMAIVYGFAEANRTIHLDKAKPEPAPIDSWMGRSHGRWDGDTLVVEAAGFNGQAWLDRAGNYATDALKVIERYRPVGPDRIDYEATLEDPNVFTRPWKIAMVLVRRPEKNAQIVEFKCVEFAEELLYGHLKRKEK